MDIVANANLLSIVLAKISAASSGAGVDLGQLVMEKSHPSVRVPAEASRPAWQAPPTRVALRLRTLVAVAPLAPGRHLDFARERRGNQLAGDLEPVTPDHIDEVPDTLPAVVEQGEIAISVQSEGVLVAGDPAQIDEYIERIRGIAGHAVGVAGVDKATLGNATGLAAGAASFLGQSAKFVQLHPESVKAIQKGQLIPGTDGF